MRGIKAIKIKWEIGILKNLKSFETKIRKLQIKNAIFRRKQRHLMKQTLKNGETSQREKRQI
jgi:hypothetical protein